MMTGLAIVEGGQEKRDEQEDIVQVDEESHEEEPEKEQNSNAEEEFVEGGTALNISALIGKLNKF